MSGLNPSILIALLIPLTILLYWIRFILGKIKQLHKWFSEVSWLDKHFYQAEMLAGIRPNNSDNAYLNPNRKYYRKLVAKGGIEYCVKLICDYINYSGPQIQVTLYAGKDGPPAQIRGPYIRLQERYYKSPHSLAAIIAHEITHAFLTYNRNYSVHNGDSELLTDYVAICLGLGKLILNGHQKAIYSSWSGGVHTVTTQTTHFGYLSFASFLYAFEKDRKLKNIPKPVAYKYLRIGTKVRLLVQNIFVNYRTKNSGQTKKATAAD